MIAHRSAPAARMGLSEVVVVRARSWSVDLAGERLRLCEFKLQGRIRAALKRDELDPGDGRDPRAACEV